MEALLKSLPAHGYGLLGLLCFVEAIGLPLPAAIAILTAGAFSAFGDLNPLLAFLAAFGGILAGDVLLFWVGRSTGWALLSILCRVSVNPESCILRSAEYFYKRGKMTLLFAKFIPGINTMSPPLAGSMKMRFQQFFRYDAVGAALYVLAYGVAGFVFSNVLRAFTETIKSAGAAAEILLALGIGAYVGYRIWLYKKYRVYKLVPRIPVTEVARRLASTEEPPVLLVDVRSHGYYDAQSQRIRGSVRIEPNNLVEEIKSLTKDKD